MSNDGFAVGSLALVIYDDYDPANVGKCVTLVMPIPVDGREPFNGYIWVGNQKETSWVVEGNLETATRSGLRVKGFASYSQSSLMPLKGDFNPDVQDRLDLAYPKQKEESHV